MYKTTDGGVVRLADSAFIPAAEGNRDWQEYLAWVGAGGTPETSTLSDLASLADARIETQLNAHAQAWGYSGIVSAVSYLGDPCARFNAEAVALRDWRSAVWVWAGEQQAAIAAGTLAMPSSVEAFVAGMPAAPDRPTV